MITDTLPMGYPPDYSDWVTPNAGQRGYGGMGGAPNRGGAGCAE